MPRINYVWAQESTVSGWECREISKRTSVPKLTPKFRTGDPFSRYYGRLPYREQLNPAQVYTGDSRESYLNHLEMCLKKLPCDSTLQVRWRVSKELPSFSMDFLFLYLSRFGKVMAIYQQAVNSCLVVFKDIQVARRVANEHDLGSPYGRLYTKWWNPGPTDNNYLRIMKHVEKAAETRTRFHSFMDNDDRLSLRNPVRASMRAMAEGNKFGGPNLKAYLCDGVKLVAMSCPKKPARSPPPPRVPQPTGVSHLQDQEHFQRLITAHRLVVVDFSAPWCGPCKMMKPIMNQLAEDFPDVTFAELDVDELTYLANENKISALPTFLFFKNGVRLDQMVGARPDLLKEKVASNK